jgi:hypothetical protein
VRLRTRANAVVIVLMAASILSVVSAGPPALANAATIGPDGGVRPHIRPHYRPAAPSQIPGYRDPFRGAALYGERIDQGVDYGGTGPITAIGPGVVMYVGSSSQSGWPGISYVGYQLVGGPAAGRYVYVAECVIPRVYVGESIGVSTVIAKATDCGYGIETGWADGQALPNAAAHDCWVRHPAAGNYNHPTGYGINFSRFMGAVGAPPGVRANSPMCPLPAGSGLPRWP